MSSTGKSDLPWKAWYEADYRKKTRWFTCAAQHGIYRGILGEYLDQGRGPVDVDEQLRAIAVATPEEWAAHWPDIKAAFFEVRDGRLWNKRAEETIAEAGSEHRERSEHAKKAAEARWGKKPTVQREGMKNAGGKAKAEQEAVRTAFSAFNEFAAAHPPLKQAAILSKTREANLRARLRECEGLAGWAAALDKLAASTFAQGGGDRGWVLHFDDLVKPKHFHALMEGKYDDKPGPKTGAATARNEAVDDDARRSAIARATGLSGRMVRRRATSGGTDEGQP